MPPERIALCGDLSAELLPHSLDSQKAWTARLVGISAEEPRLYLEHSGVVEAGTLRFRLKSGPLWLGSGTGQLISSDSAAVVVVEESQPDYHSLKQRLAPFASESDRPALLPDPGWLHPDSPWHLWVEASLRLSQLVEVAGRINSSEDLESLLAEIMEAAKTIMRAEASSLMLLDSDTRDLVIAVPTGPARAEISGVRIPAGKGFAGWVAGTGQPLIVPDAEKDPRFYGEVSRHSDFRTRNLICVPLHDPNQKIIGVLQALNRREGQEFTENDIPFFLALGDHAAIALEKARLHRESLEKQQLEKELSLAKSIQAGYWPQHIPRLSGFEMAGISLPAAQVGGDYYDFIPLDEHVCALVIADISGKGFSAALLMASLRAALRAQVKNRIPAEETISLLNDVLVDDSPSNRFVTMLYGQLDTRDRTFTYVNAGHNPPFYFDGGSFSELTEGGAILGFQKGLPFTTGTVRLEPGSTLVMFTDGVVEAQNQAEEMFGEDRLKSVIQHERSGGAESLLSAIRAAVLSFSGKAPQYDDLTLVVLRALIA
jgi:phosphoserine phosphatase RsbU/P